VTDDETQHSPTGSPLAEQAEPRGWLRRLIGRPAAHKRPGAEQDRRASDRSGVRETLLALPTLLENTGVPDGVVELLIEDFEAPWRQLLDIHDGRVKLVGPGECVPWASIAGTATAWEMALGPQRDTAQLQLTGDEPLARRVLAALSRQPAATLSVTRSPPAQTP
jgi:hypothetical protein